MEHFHTKIWKKYVGYGRHLNVEDFSLCRIAFLELMINIGPLKSRQILSTFSLRVWAKWSSIHITAVHSLRKFSRWLSFQSSKHLEIKFSLHNSSWITFLLKTLMPKRVYSRTGSCSRFDWFSKHYWSALLTSSVHSNENVSSFNNFKLFLEWHGRWKFRDGNLKLASWFQSLNQSSEIQYPPILRQTFDNCNSYFITLGIWVGINPQTVKQKLRKASEESGISAVGEEWSVVIQSEDHSW